MSKKFYVATMGCRTNQADSASIRQNFLDGKFEETQRLSQADVIVVNSCTVTHRSDQQVRQLTRRLRRANSKARLIVTGCYAQRSPMVLAEIPGVDAVVGNSHKNKIVQIATGKKGLSLESFGYRQIAEIHRENFDKGVPFQMSSAGQTGGRTRPFVKIQEGCDAKCSYCIIPSVRGPSRSAPPEQVLGQVNELVEAGFKEVVLTGIHIGTYGMHLRPRYPLDRLIGEIVAVPGLERVRLSSIEPMQLSRRITKLAEECPKIAPHFHICLQSGSNEVLKRMLRPYSREKFAEIVEEIHELLPNAAIGTDVIVGFPGETERDYLQTIEFVRKMPFAYLHVFPYSDRQGTPASRMKGKVSSRNINLRSQALRNLSEQKNQAFRSKFIGTQLSVVTLAEQRRGMRTALSDNYLKARLNCSIPPNTIITGIVEREDQEGYLIIK